MWIKTLDDSGSDLRFVDLAKATSIELNPKGVRTPDGSATWWLVSAVIEEQAYGLGLIPDRDDAEKFMRNIVTSISGGAPKTIDDFAPTSDSEPKDGSAPAPPT